MRICVLSAAIYAILSNQYTPGDYFICIAIDWCTGLDNTRFTFDAFIKGSTDRWNALALDQRGWGQSPLGNEKEYSVAAVAADIELAIQKDFGPQKVVLLGHDMGGRVAVKFAATYPDRWLHVGA